jgi:plasmid stabilization system protein ParE
MRGYDFHPEASVDLDAIWKFMADDSQDAADRMIDQIEAAIEGLSRSHIKATAAQISPRARCASRMRGITS